RVLSEPCTRNKLGLFQSGYSGGASANGQGTRIHGLLAKIALPRRPARDPAANLEYLAGGGRGRIPPDLRASYSARSFLARSRRPAPESHPHGSRIRPE